MVKRTQETNGGHAAKTALKGAPGLDDPIQLRARRIIRQEIEAKWAMMLEQYANVKVMDSSRAVVRNGYLPEREIVTAASLVPVQVSTVRNTLLRALRVSGGALATRVENELDRVDIRDGASSHAPNARLSVARDVPWHGVQAARSSRAVVTENLRRTQDRVAPEKHPLQRRNPSDRKHTGSSTAAP
ncbi:hypothetical protein [Burkholderia cepacia]|uniref:hypothetical protein n=1 Tax=Burkholderia cepacia TaxID=292 RepID=UPI0039BEBC75